MASYDSRYEKYIGPKISKLTKETTEEEIKKLYKDWATEYDKVTAHSQEYSWFSAALTHH